MGLAIDYRKATVEDLAAQGQSFDTVLAMEVVEHVADVSSFLSACERVLEPGGVLLMSTLNRTLRSFGLAIVGAEYVLRWLPRGTHDWEKFLTPKELGVQDTRCRSRASQGRRPVFRSIAMAMAIVARHGGELRALGAQAGRLGWPGARE